MLLCLCLSGSLCFSVKVYSSLEVLLLHMCLHIYTHICFCIYIYYICVYIYLIFQCFLLLYIYLPISRIIFALGKKTHFLYFLISFNLCTHKYEWHMYMFEWARTHVYMYVFIRMYTCMHMHMWRPEVNNECLLCHSTPFER